MSGASARRWRLGKRACKGLASEAGIRHQDLQLGLSFKELAKSPRPATRLELLERLDLDLADALAAHAEPLAALLEGAGATVELLSPDAIAYAMATLDFEAGSAVRKGWRWGPQFQLAVLLNPKPDYKLQLAATLASDLLQSDRCKLYTTLEFNNSLALAQDWEIRAGLSLISPVNYDEAKLTLNFYF